MRSFVAESGVEEVCLDYFADLDWQVLYGSDIAPGEPRSERLSYRDVLLEAGCERRFRGSIRSCRRRSPTRSSQRCDDPRVPTCWPRTGGYTGCSPEAYRSSGAESEGSFAMTSHG